MCSSDLSQETTTTSKKVRATRRVRRRVSGQEWGGPPSTPASAIPSPLFFYYYSFLFFFFLFITFSLVSFFSEPCFTLSFFLFQFFTFKICSLSLIYILVAYLTEFGGLCNGMYKVWETRSSRPGTEDVKRRKDIYYYNHLDSLSSLFSFLLPIPCSGCTKVTLGTYKHTERASAERATCSPSNK